MKFIKTLCIATTFFVAIACGCASKVDPMQANLTFDQLIDKAPGDEVSQSIVKSNSWYRAKQASKTIYRPIDRARFYTNFIEQFKNWCELQNGKYLSINNGASDAFCLSTDQNTMFGGYSIKITTTASHQGDMTAGEAIFSFIRDEQYQKLRNDNAIEETRKAQIAKQEQEVREKNEQLKRNTDLARRKEFDRQEICSNELALTIRSNPKIGTYTNLGMIIEVKPPLVLVQDINRKPPTIWVRLNELGPPIATRYCKN